MNPDNHLQILRYEKGGLRPATRAVVREFPLRLTVNGRELATLIASRTSSISWPPASCACRGSSTVRRTSSPSASAPTSAPPKSASAAKCPSASPRP